MKYFGEGEQMANLKLKKRILEVADNQLRENDPPVTKETYDKLIGLGKLDAIRRMQRKGLSMEEIMDMGYTKAEYKQALQTENQLIEK